MSPGNGEARGYCARAAGELMGRRGVTVTAMSRLWQGRARVCLMAERDSASRPANFTLGSAHWTLGVCRGWMGLHPFARR